VIGKFAVWVDGETEERARVYAVGAGIEGDVCAADVAEQCARDDYHSYNYEGSWPVVYRARNVVTGELFMVEVAVEMRPHFVAVREAVIPMPPTVHVLWGDRVLCEDPQLRGATASWPDGQAWISLQDFADGGYLAGDRLGLRLERATRDRCAACWKKAPGLVEGLRQIGVSK
jgi:hypothetical protein